MKEPFSPSRSEELEFGGAKGAAGIIVGSHFLVYYLWGAIQYHQGALYDPRLLWSHVVDGAMPTWQAATVYLGFLAVHLLFAYVMPGVWVKGLPVPTEGGIQHRYLCNGAASWYVTLVLAVIFHEEIAGLTGQIGPILTVATIAANAIAVAAFVLTKQRTRMTGNVVYDFFMGAVLNPRIGRVDLKFFTELRVSWILLFLLTFAAAMKQLELRGSLSLGMIFMLTAHGLYTNACMKGEECVPTTWDVFHEKWGWMLIFWNLVGVPFVYCFNSYYILVANPTEPPTWFMVLLFVALVGAYYVWDTSQSQRNRFRMMQRGTYVRRRTFPQLPWGTLKDPEYLSTANGGTLLVDGWWRYARKIHYTADIVMAFSWALACGFDGILPYLYPAFFLGMILHRAARDEARCRAKYGADWERYLTKVPDRFIPLSLLPSANRDRPHASRS